MMHPNDEVVLIFTPTTAVVRKNVDGKPQGIENDEVARIVEQAMYAFEVITDEFELSQIVRIEYRELYHFPCESLEASEEWIKDLGLVTVTPNLYQGFGKHYAMAWSILTVAEECRYRLELKGTERNASVPVGEGELSIKQSMARHLQRREYIELMKLKRHKQIDPEYYVILDITAFLWAEMPADFDIRGFVAPKVTENLNLFRRCFSSE
jgi:hypothetical protein